MTRWRAQRGDMPVGCLVGLVLVFLAVLIGIKAVPARVKVGELAQEISSQADRANRYDYTDEKIRERIVIKAAELNLPVTKDDVKIERTHSRIKIHVSYDYVLKFPGYTYVWHKEHDEDRPLF